jgi:hypothetical protein
MFTLYDRAAVGVYPNLTAAETAVRALEQAGIRLNDISIVAPDDQIREALGGRYGPPDYVEHELQHQSEQEGAWLGGLFGLLVGFSSFLLPGVGLLALFGPLAGLVGGAGLGAIVGDISGQLTFTEFATEYRETLAAGAFLVIVHCTTAEEPHVFQVFEDSKPHTLRSGRLIL